MAKLTEAQKIWVERLKKLLINFGFDLRKQEVNPKELVMDGQYACILSFLDNSATAICAESRERVEAIVKFGIYESIKIFDLDDDKLGLISYFIKPAYPILKQ